MTIDRLSPILLSCLPSCIFCSSLVHGHQTVAIHPPLLASTQIIIPSPAPISPCRYVIDPEFGFYGPMAFDVAKILANLILTVFATYGLEATEPHKPRAEQRGERMGGGRGGERGETGEGGADDRGARGRGGSTCGTATLHVCTGSVMITVAVPTNKNEMMAPPEPQPLSMQLGCWRPSPPSGTCSRPSSAPSGAPAGCRGTSTPGWCWGQARRRGHRRWPSASPPSSPASSRRSWGLQVCMCVWVG